jgi:hypothetical protein
MKRKLKAAAALVLGTSMLITGAAAASSIFADVPRTHWAYQQITRAADEGLVSGMGNGVYGVNNQLSNAEFATMVCGMFYTKEVREQGSSGDWWRPYLEAAYQVGVLSGTEAGTQRSQTQKWSSSVANAKISRYDMAQIIMNVAEEQDWASPTLNEMAIAVTKIADWTEIPARYQTAVTVAYAKGYLGGMDDKGTFKGDSNMTRAQAAVVLCNLLDAKEEVDAPVYTNTTKLVNGKEPTWDNVYAALLALKTEFGQSEEWDMDREYTSEELGSGEGSQGFAYMLSDRVFGAMEATKQSDIDRMKPGDVLYLRNEDSYAVVLTVDGNDFTYVTCNSKGIITWRGSGYLDELTSRDTIYTRYTASVSDELANGDSVTERNVKKALSDLEDSYADGDVWNMDWKYRSNVMGSVYGSEAFAWTISDEVFGELEVTEHRKAEDLRPGDVVHLDDYDEYVVVLDVGDDEFDYLGVTAKGTIYWDGRESLDSLDRDDTIYTRYLEESQGGSSSSGDEELTNGKSVTEKNVAALMEELQEEYEQGYEWDSRYSSDVLGSGSGGKGFVYLISDEIFGDLDVAESSKADLRVGDLIDYSLEDDYVIVVSVNEDTGRFVYAGVNDKGRVYWNYGATISGLGRNDTIYTRYPDGVSNSDREEEDTLTNGKSATEKNVYALLEEMMEDYEPGDKWDLDERYTSDVMGSAWGSEAFVYFVSDKVFGDLEAVELEDTSELRVGDIIDYDYEGDYVLVVEIDGDEFTYAGVSASGRVYWDGIGYFDDFGRRDTVYTRYPDTSSSNQDKDTLSNGKRATESNVADFLSDLKADYRTGQEWDERYSSGVLGTATGSRGFVYFLSDEIFADLDVEEHSRPENAKIGDVIYLSKFEEYAMVVGKDDEGLTYAGVDNDDEIFWNAFISYNNLSRKDTVYTRYP